MATKQIDGVTNVTSTSTVNNGGVGMNVGTSSILTNRSLSLAGEKQSLHQPLSTIAK